MKILDYEVEVGDGVAVGGLTVFPLTGVVVDGPPYLTGPEAFEMGLLQVSELDPPQVPFLAVTNLAEVPILLVEGEMLVGGDQNRTMNVTVLCPPGERTVVPVSCVEAGRWGMRRTMGASRRHAPGSLRAAKTANLEERSADVYGRRSDQQRVWAEVERQSMSHGVHSDTFALDDVQAEVEQRIEGQLEQLETVQGQVGIVCAIGDQVVGLDLFDRTSTLETYLRGIVAGHALDAPAGVRPCDSISSVVRFLAQVEANGLGTGPGIGLGEEILLRGDITGIGLTYERRLLHLAAFPVAV
jgi:hypothetical protein